jgi:hypothetical protein
VSSLSAITCPFQIAFISGLLLSKTLSERSYLAFLPGLALAEAGESVQLIPTAPLKAGVGSYTGPALSNQPSSCRKKL